MKALSIARGLIVVLGLSACQTVDRGSFGPFIRSLSNTPHGYAVIEDPTGSAPTELVERFEVRPGDCGSDDCANDAERSELKEQYIFSTLGTTRWYGWSLYVPEDYVNIFPTKVALGQFHQSNSHVVWMFQNSSGGYHLDDQVYGSTRRYYELIDENDLRGKWHRIEVHAKWSRKDDGFFKVWVNGEPKVDYSGQTMTATITFFKYGLYRSFMSRYKNVSRYRNAKGSNQVPGQMVFISQIKNAKGAKEVEVPGQVAYYANVRRANSREGLVAPANRKIAQGLGDVQEWVTKSTLTTELLGEAALGNTRAVQRLLEQGEDVNAKNYDGVTALMAAARGGKAATVELLIANGANVNAKNNAGETALVRVKIGLGIAPDWAAQHFRKTIRLIEEARSGVN